MSNKRIHEVAKELNTHSKDLIEQLSTIGISVKNHMSTITDDEIKKLSSVAKKEPVREEKHEVKPQAPAQTTTQTTPQQTTQTNTQTRPENGYRNNQNNDNRKPYNNNNNYNKDRNNNQYNNQYNKKPYNNQQGSTQGNTQNSTQGSTQGNQQGSSQTSQQSPQQQNRPYNQNRNNNYQQRPYNNNNGGNYNNNNGSGNSNNNTGGTGGTGGTGTTGGNNYQQRNNNYQNRNNNYQQKSNNFQPRNNNSQGSSQGSQGATLLKPAVSQPKITNYQEKQQHNKKFANAPSNDINAKKGSGFKKEIDKNMKQTKNFAYPAAVKQKPKNRPKHTNKVERVEEVVVPEVEILDDIKIIRIAQKIVVKELASKIDTPVAEIIKKLMKLGHMAGINQEIDYYIAAKVAESYDCVVEKIEEEDILKEAFLESEEDALDNLDERPPIVVVMGHVDHGKTSLLDAIRKSKVASGEAGGITQHIGAYTVPIHDKIITFLDTPGHEAFTAMRMRGARVTDIAILVVAADDGVMPQTIEAINHAKAAGVEIIVAINKIDKPSANLDRVKQELSEHGILTEDWGGEIICAPVSAVSQEGIEQLLEMIILVSEMKELRANPKKKARGTIIEALLDKGRGPVATVLVQNGTLNVGDPIVAGSTYGKIRAMMDDKGRKVKSAPPSTPVEILGLSDIPLAGDAFYVADSDKQARQVAESMIAKGREGLIKDTPSKVSLEDLFTQIKEGTVKDLNIVVKADVQGSVEAVKNSLERLSNDEVRIKTIHGGVGAITESDVMLASASNAIIIGFNIKIEPQAKSVSEIEKVDVRLYRIIYNAIEDITAAMKGMLDPIYKEKIMGHAEIRQIFKSSSVGAVAGSYILDGKITRSCKVRVFRDTKLVFDGALDTLKRFKDDVKEVSAGYECGLLFHKFTEIQEGDKVEAYILEEVER